MKNKILLGGILLFGFICPEIQAQQITRLAELVAVQDTVSPSDTLQSPLKRKNKVFAYLNRLFHGNVDHTFERKFDMNFVAAPSYTREASFGLGAIMTGLYRLDRSDSIMQPSDISIAANASLLGFYSIVAKGNNLFKGNRARLSYKVAFTNKPLNFWGITYDDCAVNPKSKYTRKQIKWDIDYVYRLTKEFYIGTTSTLNYADVSKIENAGYLLGQNRTYFFAGLGVLLQYDTRDFIPNPQRGVYLMLKEVFYPDFFATFNRNLFATTVIFDVYQKAWEGSVIAADIYGQFNNKDLPWPLREELGTGGVRMRGYYGGRYIDNNQIACQVELRQHIAGRFGCVVWGGAGTVFPTLKKFDWAHILPNYGLGLRFEFKHNVNVRVDYGFGKGTSGFVFNFGEAF